MFAKMDGQRAVVESDRAVSLDEIVRTGVRGDPDISALASVRANGLSVLVWHYHDDDVPGSGAEVKLVLSGLALKSGEARLQHFRIDEEHSNAFAAWKKLGSPQQPTAQQYEQLEKAGQL